jgi:2-methylisocitrate lyase-like PEP mutase family enzyme
VGATSATEWAISQAKRFVDAGAYMIMIESESITENVKTWRTDVVAKIINALGLEKPMFEAADPTITQLAEAILAKVEVGLDDKEANTSSQRSMREILSQ